MHARFLITFAVLLLAGCGSSAPTEGQDLSRSPSVKQEAEAKTTISLADVRMYEGIADNTARLVFSLPTSGGVELELTVESGTATDGGDYTFIDRTIVVPSGAITHDIPISIVDDNVYEGTEDLTLRYSITRGGEQFARSVNEFALTILDDEPLPAISFDEEVVFINEGVGEIEFPVSLSNPASTEVQINFELSGTANKDEDYETSLDGVIVVEPLSRQGTFTLSVIDDDVVEGGESVVVHFISGDYVRVEPGTTLSVIINGDAKMNDTGFGNFLHDGALSAQPSPTLPNQDASYGRDAGFPNENDGRRGFSFTKLDANGNELPISANATCIRDNTSGVVYELKTQSFPLETLYDEQTERYSTTHNWRANNYLYTWYNPLSEGSGTGGSIGAHNNLLRDRYVDLDGYCAFRPDVANRYYPLACNTYVYLNELNLTGLCGIKTWRLPRAEELRSVIDYELAFFGHDGIDESMFTYSATGSYFTASPSAEFEGSAWCFEDGKIRLCHKGSLNKIRGVADE
ncbi:MAG: hypothetical protein C9356_12310 [Oleiphilus sp.]|nr:MAG: hypothetical protein C9356_12310 [Oleiphilus sp.]